MYTWDKVCEHCTVVPVMGDNSLCAMCMDEVIDWLWHADQEYLQQVQQQYEDAMYSQQANGGI